MSLITEAVVFIFVSLVVINGLLGGGVVEAIGTFATDEEKAEARKDLMCGTGYLMLMPTTGVMGFDVPSPSYTNVIVAALLSLSIILVIRIATGIDWKFKYSIALFIIVWVMIKIIGFVLMSISGDDCMVWAESMVEQTSGFYNIAALGGSLWGLRLLWGMRK